MFHTPIRVRCEQLLGGLAFDLISVMLPHPECCGLRASFDAGATALTFQAVRESQWYVKGHTLYWSRTLRDQAMNLQIRRHFAFRLDAVKQSREKQFVLRWKILDNG